MVNRLALHIAYDQLRNISISCTNIVSWLLLYKAERYKPISVSKLNTWFEWYKGDVLYRGHFLNFQAPFQNLLEHSLRMLKPHVEYNKRTRCVVVREKLDSLIYLNYHANTLNMIYALDAVVAMSILKSNFHDYKHKIDERTRRRRWQIEEQNKIINENNNIDNNSINKNNNNVNANGKIRNNVILCDSLRFSGNKLHYRDIVDNNVKEKINSGFGSGDKGVNSNNNNDDDDNNNDDDNNDGDDSKVDKDDLKGDNAKNSENAIINEGDKEIYNRDDEENNDNDDDEDDGGDDDVDDDFSMTFYQKDILRTAAELTACLKYEFLFTPPCKKLYHTLMEAFYRVVDAHNIVNQEELMSDDDDEDFKPHHNRPLNIQYLDMQVENSAESDLIYVVRRASLHRLRQQTLLLQPLLHTYTIVASHLTALLSSHLPEKEFVWKAQEELKNRYKSKQLKFGESVCHETVSNCVKMMVDNDVISTYKSPNDVKMIKLSEGYSDEAKLQNLVSHISSFSSIN